MVEHLRIPADIGTFDALADGPPDGRPVVLLHGFPEASIQWESQLRALGAAGCRAVAPDQRGYSPDVRPADVLDYALDNLVGDVLTVADSFGWAEFDLVGHDWGAGVAWAVAAAHPERVRTLAAVSVPHLTPFAQALRSDDDQRQRSAYIDVYRQVGSAEQRLLADDAAAIRRMFGQHVPSERVDEYVARMTVPGALTAALNWYRANDLSAVDLAPVDMPTLYVWGSEDIAIGATAAQATAKYVTGPYRFERLAGVSHWVTEEVGEQLDALLLRHLADHPV
jgi:pimeloyl-ACP methyl ester carboxylesterase